jgi:hypothetical protein
MKLTRFQVNVKRVRKLSFFVCILSFAGLVWAQNKMGDNSATIYSGALLELESQTKGFRLPRIPLNDVTKWSLDSTAVSGMLIYNETGTAPKGLYYWNTDSAKWVRPVTQTELASLIATYITKNTSITDSIIQVINTTIAANKVKGNNLTNAGGITIVGGDSTTLKATTLAIDTAYLAKAISTNTTIIDSITSVVNNTIYEGAITGKNLTSSSAVIAVTGGTGTTLQSTSIDIDKSQFGHLLTSSPVKDSLAVAISDSIAAIRALIKNDRDSVITAGAITSVPVVGDNFGKNITAAQFIQAAFFQSQAPTAALSGGTNLELMSSGSNLTKSLSYSITLKTATVSPVTGTLTSTDSQSYSLGNFTATTTNTQSVALQRNVNTTFTLTATSSDSKSATATTSFKWYPKAYYGYSSGVPTTTEILAVSGGASYFSAYKASSGSPTSSTATLLSTIVPSSGYYHVFYAYPVSFGALTSIYDKAGNGLLSAFTVTTVSLTNSSGYTQDYYVYYSNNTYLGTTLYDIYQ